MVRFFTVVSFCVALGICHEGSAQILRGRQRSYQQAPQASPPPGTTPPPAGSPSTPSRPNQPTPAGSPPKNPTPGDKPWYQCDDCGNPDCKGEGPCEKVNEPKITQSGGPDCTTRDCVEIKNRAVGDLPSVPGTYTPFYKECIKFNGTVKIPHHVLNKQDELLFAKKSYAVDCCKFTVCVVQCCCTTTTKGCDLRPLQVKLEACIRQNGLIDVYVLNVPGMPERWVYLMGIGLNDLRTQFSEFPGFKAN